jgi:hypothetical protein
MGNPPFRPLRVIERELARGQLSLAIGTAKDFAREHGHAIPLDAALAFLPLVSIQRADHYDLWACRWLARWLTESDGATIDRGVELAAALAELPIDPDAALAVLRPACRQWRARLAKLAGAPPAGAPRASSGLRL